MEGLTIFLNPGVLFFILGFVAVGLISLQTIPQLARARSITSRATA